MKTEDKIILGSLALYGAVILGNLAFWGFVIYVAYHFLHRLW